MSNVTTIEQQIQAKASKAPRVTPADIEAAILTEHYFTAADGMRFLWLAEDHSDPAQRDAVERIAENIRVRSHAGICQDIDANSNGVVSPSLPLLTFCVLVLRNGFTVTGTSAVVSPENFDAGIGRRVAREDAVRQVWPLLGYALREHLAATPTDWKDRVLLERERVHGDLQKLRDFLCGPVATALHGVDIDLLRQQAEAMQDYVSALDARIERFAPAVSSID